ncbi:transketolase [Alkaliphilus metalliredigens QYMF]|uniref:Transketolase n=1 Tax=Alkaliphilus metalliredigens (strain QYMF) TaxID=293826 RepID=A6TX00_ALKMQ|nr:transketolase [Alkaliphilus metalliredigens]ABR50718.1 transketolase [Alkaliphilus metalliredigens QYMF]
MKQIEQKAINTIRLLAVDGVEKANSGHPGLPMGAAPMAYTLWSQFLNHSPNDPQWTNRDRFVLSAGHGSMLIYSLLHLFNYGLTIEDLQNFRQWGSKTPGHPEFGHTVGIETTTGPLGQGLTNAVGMAMAERRLAAEFNRDQYDVVDHYTYVIAGDGDMMEGITSEAASLAGHLGLHKLICLYDDNNISIDGNTSLTFTEDVAKRYEAYGWQVVIVKDGNDVAEITKAIKAAKENKEQPTLIKVKTTIGFGSPNKQGTAGVHGAPLGKDEIQLTRKTLEWAHDEDFFVPEDVKGHFDGLVKDSNEKAKVWEEMFKGYSEAHPELAKAWKQWHSRELPQELLKDASLWEFSEKPMATRSTSGEVMNRLKKHLPNLMGGSADLNPSTKTYLKEMGDFQKGEWKGNNIYFGVREHAMAGITNGMALHGGLRVFCSTFFVFSDYMKPAIRLSALMKQPVVYVFTHDSIGVGEDGPTHQPIEHLLMLRSIPNVQVLRPADGKETTAAWIQALKHQEGPTVLVLSRQNLAQLEGSGQDAAKGAYVVSKGKKETPDMILMASGSEVPLAIEAQKALQDKGIEANVVSMMSWELFKNQSKEYQEEILPKQVTKRISIETGVTLGWSQFIGDAGIAIGIDDFGASAPGEVLMDKYGFTVENIVEKAMTL